MGVGEIATDAMQIRCDQNARKSMGAGIPGRCPLIYSPGLVEQTQMAVAAVALGTGSEAGRQRRRGRKEEGKRAHQEDRVQSRRRSASGVIGPTQNQNIRSRVGQATTRQRDWQPTLNFAHETRQNASQRSHFPFQPNPCRQLFPGLSCLCAGLSGCLDPGLAQQLHQLPALQYAMFAFC